MGGVLLRKEDLFWETDIRGLKRIPTTRGERKEGQWGKRETMILRSNISRVGGEEIFRLGKGGLR